LLTAFSKFDGFTPIFANLFKNFTQKDQAQAIEENTVQAEVISLEKIFEALIFYIKNDIEHTPLNDKVRNNVLEDIVTPEFLFLMKVDFPCQFFYHERPSRIFKEACLGDKESLKKLLLLDKVIIRHPMISKWLHLYSYNENKSVIEDLSAAISKPPGKKLSLVQEKYRMAGMISYYTELLGYRLSTPEIRHLFNAVAADYGIDELIDPDLPDSPEAFERAVRRQRADWKKSLANNRTKLS